MSNNASLVKEKIPDSYLRATSRAVLPPDNGRMGISFDIEGGPTIRLNLSIEDVVTTCEVAILIAKGQDAVQPEMSAGIPSVAVSPQDGSKV